MKLPQRGRTIVRTMPSSSGTPRIRKGDLEYCLEIWAEIGAAYSTADKMASICSRRARRRPSVMRHVIRGGDDRRPSTSALFIPRVDVLCAPSIRNAVERTIAGFLITAYFLPLPHHKACPPHTSGSNVLERGPNALCAIPHIVIKGG